MWPGRIQSHAHLGVGCHNRLMARPNKLWHLMQAPCQTYCACFASIQHYSEPIGKASGTTRYGQQQQEQPHRHAAAPAEALPERVGGGAPTFAAVRSSMSKDDLTARDPAHIRMLVLWAES